MGNKMITLYRRSTSSYSDDDSEPITGDDVTSDRKTFPFDTDDIYTSNNPDQACETAKKLTIGFEKVEGKRKENVYAATRAMRARYRAHVAESSPRVVPLINVHKICSPLPPCVKVVTLAIRESTITFARGGERVAHKPRERFLFLRVYGIKSLCPCLNCLMTFTTVYM